MINSIFSSVPSIFSGDSLSLLIALLTLAGWVFTQIKYLENRDDDKFKALQSEIKDLESRLNLLASDYKLSLKDENLSFVKISQDMTLLKTQIDAKNMVFEHKINCVYLSLIDVSNFLQVNQGFISHNRDCGIFDSGLRVKDNA